MTDRISALLLFGAVVAIAMAVGCTVRAVSAATVIRLTYYLPTGNVMASGGWPYAGAASCSPDIGGFGTVVRFPLTGERVTCLDTGSGVTSGQIDVFVWTAADGAALTARLGDYAEIEVNQ